MAVRRGQDLARERGVDIDWQIADVTAYRPEADAYDLVLIAYLHLPRPDLATVLRHAASAVRPGGSFVLVGHDLANLTAGTGGPQDAAVLQTPEMVVAELPGMRIHRSETARRPVRMRDKTVDALDTVVAATRP